MPQRPTACMHAPIAHMQCSAAPCACMQRNWSAGRMATSSSSAHHPLRPRLPVGQGMARSTGAHGRSFCQSTTLDPKSDRGGMPPCPIFHMQKCGCPAG
eukprot:352824-Chlamydomonas_euryale.AAC.6